MSWQNADSSGGVPIMALQSRMLLIAALFINGPSLLMAQHAGDKIGVLKRVDPATAERLPAWLKNALAKRHCLIPQVHSDDNLTNIARGLLVDSTTESYALLCSRAGSSSVLVVTRDPALAPPPILLRPDTSFLAAIGFTRFLHVLKPSEVQKWCPLPAPERRRVHDGVITFDQDRDATAYYLAQTSRKWIRCTVPDPD